MKWSWSGAVVLVLAVCVGITWGTTIILVLLDGTRLTDTGKAVLWTMSGTIVGVIVGWMNKRDKDE